MWNRFIKNYFTFTRRERNGLIVLLLVMLIITFWPAIASWIYKEPPTDFTAFSKVMDSLNDHSQLKDSTIENPHRTIAELDAENDNNAKGAAAALFAFDPNTLDENGWNRLGLPAKTVKTILKYRAGGGKFYKNDDLKKIYGLKPSDFERIAAYIEIKETWKKSSEQNHNDFKKESKPLSFTAVELNSADTAALNALRGIGSVLSSRIIKYREKLGGFVSVDQLKDVYGLSPETFESVKKQVTIDSNRIIKIEINTIDAFSLSHHPYFKNPIAKTIISYRDQHGIFKSIEDLKNVDIITQEVFQKILPYIKL